MEKDIDTLKRLRKEIDMLYTDIFSSCLSCSYKCCQGFINVLPREIENIVDNGIEIIEINDEVYFLNNFEKDEKDIPVLNVFAPKCLMRDCEKKCTINKIKPIVCSLYPIIPDRAEDGKLVWALHLDCAYSEKIQRDNKVDEIKEQFIKILNRITPSLYREIKESFERVNAICTYPKGYNKILKIKEV